VRGKFESCLTGKFSQEAEDYEDDAGIESLPPSSSADGHRRFCSRLKKGLAGTGSCVATSEGFSQRMLTRTLRNLESTGLVARRVTASKAIAVEYSLTQLGTTIVPPLRGMCRWAKRFGRDVSADVHLPKGSQVQ